MKVLLSLPVGLAILLLTVGALAQRSDRDLGIDLYREGKFAEAIESLEKSVAADKTDRAAWIYLGGAYVHTGNKEKAADAFESARVRPNAPQPKFDRSVRVIRNPKARLPGGDARLKLQDGRVRVAVEYRADGTIGFVFPLRTKATELVEPSVEAAKGIQFEPAMRDGKPVTVINFSEYDFSFGNPRKTGTD